jgi:hypothetical protein
MILTRFDDRAIVGNRVAKHPTKAVLLQIITIGLIAFYGTKLVSPPTDPIVPIVMGKIADCY